MKMIRIALVIAGLLVVPVLGSASALHDDLRVVPYPKIVLYSAPWCKSCNAAKDYFLRNNIPFVKKDIAVDERYLEEMAAKYRSSAVPVIVIGRDQKVLRGFVPEMFNKAFGEVLAANSR